MSAPHVLRGCEAVTVEGDKRVVCGQPGKLWDAPLGRTYVLCSYHEQIFEPAVQR